MLKDQNRPTTTGAQGNTAYCFTDDERGDIYTRVCHQGESVRSIARDYGVSDSVINRVIRGMLT